MTISCAGSAKLALRMFVWVVGPEWVLFMVPPLLATASGLAAGGVVMLPWGVTKTVTHFKRQVRGLDARPRKGVAEPMASAPANYLRPFSVAIWATRVSVLITAYDFFVMRYQWQDALLAGGVAAMGAGLVVTMVAEIANAKRHVVTAG